MIGYRPDHAELYEDGYSFDGKQWRVHIDDGVSPIFTGEEEPPKPRAIDLQTDAEPENNRLPILIEKIRTMIFDESQEEIEGTAQELSERFGYQEPAQFGRDIRLVKDKLMEFGIDIEETRTNTTRYLRIYENEDSPYHPIQQNPD